MLELILFFKPKELLLKGFCLWITVTVIKSLRFFGSQFFPSVKIRFGAREQGRLPLGEQSALWGVHDPVEFEEEPGAKLMQTAHHESSCAPPGEGGWHSVWWLVMPLGLDRDGLSWAHRKCCSGSGLPAASALCLGLGPPPLSPILGSRASEQGWHSTASLPP